MTHSFTWTCREVLNEEITNIPTPAHHHSPRQLLSGPDGSSSPTPGNWFRSLSCPLSSGYLMQLSNSPPQTPSPPEMWHSVVPKASFWKPEVKPLGLLHLTTIKSLRLWTHRRVDPGCSAQPPDAWWTGPLIFIYSFILGVLRGLS